MKLVDAFIFYNEIELLKFRLKELNDVVDYFIICEATHTFAGNPKKLYFTQNQEQFKEYTHKIILVIVDDIPDTNNAWTRETHQRNCIIKGVDSLKLNNDDLIIIADVDEIPDKNTLANIKKTGLTMPCALEQDFYYYNLNCKSPDKWASSTILNVGSIDHKSINEIRNITRGMNTIKNGGWHFSYFGDQTFIKNKIQQFSHQEYNNDEYTNEEKIKKCIDAGTDLFFRDYVKWNYMPLDKNKYLPENYKMLLTTSNTNEENINAYYGYDDKFVNVTNILLTKFKKDNTIIIPKKYNFKLYFGDLSEGIKKELTIKIGNSKQAMQCVYTIYEEHVNEDIIIKLV